MISPKYFKLHRAFLSGQSILLSDSILTNIPVSVQRNVSKPQIRTPPAPKIGTTFTARDHGKCYCCSLRLRRKPGKGKGRSSENGFRDVAPSPSNKLLRNWKYATNMNRDGGRDARIDASLFDCERSTACPRADARFGEITIRG